MKNKLPVNLIERIFMRFHGRFGNLFFDMYRIGQLNDDGEDIGIINAKNVWAEDCGHLSKERIMKGINTKFDYPPNCDAFIKACLPSPECHTDFKKLPKPKKDKTVIENGLKKMHAALEKRVVH